MKILRLGDNISSRSQAKIALKPTGFSPIGKGFLSLKKNPVSSTVKQGVEQVLY